MNRNHTIPPIHELRPIAQGAKQHRSEWHYIIHRKLSVYVTWVLLHTGVTANQVSVLGLLCGVAGAVMVLAASGGWIMGGLCLFYGYFLLDKVDGEIARFREQQSLCGICLDYIGHMVIPPLVPLSVGGLLARLLDLDLLWLAGALTALAVMYVRVERDIPVSIVMQKGVKEPRLIVNVIDREAIAKAQNDKRAGRVCEHKRRGGLVVGRELIFFWASFFPSLFLLFVSSSIYVLRPDTLQIFGWTYLLVCCLSVLAAGVKVLSLLRSVKRKVRRSFETATDVIDAVRRK